MSGFGSCNGFVGAVGNTPLIRIDSLSQLTGCNILAKAEFVNPGGSVKDRTAKGLITDAERDGRLTTGGVIVEGTAGNTGIGLALVAASRGYRCTYMPDNQSQEKIDLLRTFGAEVIVVPAVPFANPNHFYHQSKRRASEIENAFFTDQAAGTGGTIAGVSCFLKEKNRKYPFDNGINIVNGKMEGDGRKTITQGIGILRLTANFKKARIDGAMQGEDIEAVEMVHYLLRKEGLFLGSSSGLNCVGAVRLAQKVGPGHTIVTILADGGQRYITGLFNKVSLKEAALLPVASTLEEFMQKKEDAIKTAIVKQ